MSSLESDCSSDEHKRAQETRDLYRALWAICVTVFIALLPVLYCLPRVLESENKRETLRSYEAIWHGALTWFHREAVAGMEAQKGLLLQIAIGVEIVAAVVMYGLTISLSGALHCALAACEYACLSWQLLQMWTLC